ncbi:CarD family transcriptional regulator [Rhabdaerophilum calidifontis]|uniref:CarD family transcriptional regulator n=1 Tax=Rhabdaerophilum calidifontis TaxID=2604328 RepID=UPI00123C4984|nr:CarD family transcriptional regulator [Rhabdaerophilum calidifontis]
MSTKKTQRDGFRPGESIVYPAHGVGQVVAIEEQEIAGFKLELFVVNFAKEKMTLRVPVAKVASVGMRKLSDAEGIAKALEVLTGRARIKRTMWSRRAQEYEAKINSGDIIAVAEVVRDLYRSEAQPEQSYSERQLFETALARLVDEVAAVDGSTDTEAMKRIETSLAKGPRRTRGTDASTDAEADNDDSSEEAA